MVDGYSTPGDEIELDEYRCDEPGNDTGILIAAGSSAHCKHFLTKVIDNGGLVGVEDDFQRNFKGTNQNHQESEEEKE